MSHRKFSSRVLKITLLIAMASLAVYGLLLYCTPCRIVAVVLAGRSGQCTLQEAFASQRWEAESRGLPRVKNLRVVRQETDGCQLWESDQWQIWSSSPRVRWFGSQWVEGAPLTRYRTLDTTGEALIRPGDVMLDCGAFIGDSALEALALGAKLVISIEPSPRNLACLRRNLQEHTAAGRVIVVEKGVWDRDDYFTLVEHPTHAVQDHILEAHDSSPEGQGLRVPLTTIDKLVEELKLERVDFIKMDIEGAEQRAIVGAKNTMAKYKPRLAIAAYHLPTDIEKIPSLVKSFQPEYQMERGRCLLEGWRIWPHLLYFH